VQVMEIAALPQAFLIALRSQIQVLGSSIVSIDDPDVVALRAAMKRFRMVISVSGLIKWFLCKSLFSVFQAKSEIEFEKAEPCYGFKRASQCSGHGDPVVGTWNTALGAFDTSTCSCRCDPGYIGSACDECIDFACCTSCVDLFATYWTGPACGDQQLYNDRHQLYRFYRKNDPTKMYKVKQLLDLHNWTLVSNALMERYPGALGSRDLVKTVGAYQETSGKAGTMCCR
jgi:hypothetical protein